MSLLHGFGRRMVTLLAALALVLSAAGVISAFAQPARASGFGVCSILQAGKQRWDGNRLYECKYIKGVGWLWIYVGTFGGCAVTRLTAAC